MEGRHELTAFRYTRDECKRLASSLSSWFEILPEYPEELKKIKANRIFLLEWCISENIPKESIPHIEKKSPLFSIALKKAKQIQELRLIELGLSIKNSVFCIFALKNLAGWRDDPDAAKGSNVNKLTLELHLPSKFPLGDAAKAMPINAKVVEIDGKKYSRAQGRNERKMLAEAQERLQDSTLSIEKTTPSRKTAKAQVEPYGVRRHAVRSKQGRYGKSLEVIVASVDETRGSHAGVRAKDEGGEWGSGEQNQQGGGSQQDNHLSDSPAEICLD